MKNNKRTVVVGSIIKRSLHVLAIVAFSVLWAGCATSKMVSGVKPYPLKVCLVTGNDLDSMGDTRVEVYQGQELRFCCKPCVRKFYANPEKYLSKLKG
jgi:nitrous oxide reductase accessory protein NosL